MNADRIIPSPQAPRRPSILIVCGYFPPLNNTAARRPYLMARHFADKGHKVGMGAMKGSGTGWRAPLDGIEVLRGPSTKYPQGQGNIKTLMTRIYWKLRGSRSDRFALFMADIMLPLNIAKRMDLRVDDLEPHFRRCNVVMTTH